MYSFFSQYEALKTWEKNIQFQKLPMPVRCYWYDDKVNCEIDKSSGVATISCKVMDTQNEGHTSRIEKLHHGDKIILEREPQNKRNGNNIKVLNTDGEFLGNLAEEVGNLISPFIDAGDGSISDSYVFYVMPLSKSDKKDDKAKLYVAFNLLLNNISTPDETECTVCLLGGQHIDRWAQKLTVYHCKMPLKTAELFFEIYNRCKKEYSSDPDSVMYMGLDGLAEEFREARLKMISSKKPGLDYSRISPGKGSCRLYKRFECAVNQEPERYGAIKEYLYNKHSQYADSDFLPRIFELNSVYKEEYFWLDENRVDYSEWTAKTVMGFSYWYKVLELFDKGPLPVDLSCEKSIFGTGKFVAIANLS